MLLLTLFLSLNAFSAGPPPKVLYHVGHREFLQADERLKTIPDDVWNESIMGRRTRYGLVPWRRGLYGGSDFDALEIYANLLLGSPNGKAREPWVMKITIKEECRKPGAVTDLATDERYLDWLLRNVSGLLQAAPFCLNRSASTCGEIITGTQAIAAGREENTCDDLLQGFMEEANPRVVEDSKWRASWYLRDRDCIEKLEASDGAVLEALAALQWDHEAREGTFAPTAGGYGLGPLVMLMQALEGPGRVNDPILDSIRTKTAASDIRHGPLAKHRRWLREAGPAIIDSYRRCREAGTAAAYQEHAAAFRKRLNDAAYLNSEQMPAELIAGFAGLCSRR